MTRDLMTKRFQGLRPIARFYTAAVILAGTAVIAHSVYAMTIDPIGKRWIILALLTLLTGSFNVKVPTLSVYISVYEVFVFTAILMYGTPAGTATVVLECLTV